ncbi:PLP-dependent aminotransferase family protein [Haloarchaeobius salinus]|uniref:aminotransferase-like domain-containing protein n=1 Tax=Haloarchaeobius salinus TaxID=1198298 RepID=UPI00210A7E23|nr:PLP-dependent aminotransferase family protein [Haloarchaeobius salinus]
MDYEEHLATRARELEPVEIRKVVDLIDGEDVIPLAAGWPNAETFPSKKLAELAQESLQDEKTSMLQYGVTQGEDRLRKKIAERLRTHWNMSVSSDEVMITSGSQQALYLIGRALLSDDDTAVVGAPTYVAALTAFENLTDVRYVTVPLDEDGLDIEYLDRQLEEKSPSLAYVVPSFQNPTGLTMSKSRRHRLVELAKEHDFLIVEDSPYAELSFESAPPQPIASINRSRTIYLGSFSKVLAPGLRVGWLVAPEELIQTFKLLKQPIDLHTSTVSQSLVSAYLESGDIDEQIERISDFYSQKRDLALDTMEKSMPEYVEWTRPRGGMFLWLTLPERYDTEELLRSAIDEGVAFIPGHAFYASDPQHNTLRVNYTFVEDEALTTGIELLAKTIRNF